MHRRLVDAICGRLLGTDDVALLGPPALAAEVQARVGAARLLIVGDARLRRCRRTVPALCGDPGALPLAPGSLDAIVGVSILGRAEDPAEIIDRWALLLRSPGQIIALESAPFPPWRWRLRPEDLTACFLNAGLVAIGQVFEGNRVLTCGTTGVLTGRCRSLDAG